ncbi:hypothetical protein EJ110_NYTH08147 [Nymphaea thermarum]|nr:hypothetical protein EJ110_NYTH08147 [Nymphaea thermarum]
MGVHGWCFCAGGGKTEKMKGSIFGSKGPAMASVCGGTGFLIHRALLLTTHTNLPSVSAAEGVEIRLHCQTAAKLVPHRFFITSSVLDLTVVGFDIMESDNVSQAQQPHPLKACSNPCLDLGNVVYLLGHTGQKELTVGDGKVVIATDNLIKVSTDGVTWSPGSAGFDLQGNLAFMVCDPMKLASSPTTKSSSTTSSSTSSKKDHSTQFGIPIPIICQWLKQHWEGSLDELSKPKIPLMRLMSTGQKSEPSSASFTLRRVFKSTEEEDNDTLSSQICSRPVNEHGLSGSAASSAFICQEPHISHEQGIPTPEIYESPKLTACPLRKMENPQVHLLDINFPPMNSKAVMPLLAVKETTVPANSSGVSGKSQHDNDAQELVSDNGSAIAENPLAEAILDVSDVEAGASNVEFADDTHSEVQSSSPVEVSAHQKIDSRYPVEYSSDNETMYSAETRESRNYSSPREQRLPHVGRSQSCVSYSRWGNTHRNSIPGQKPMLEKQRSLFTGRKMGSQTATYRTHDYFSPTVSSIMKKRNSTEQQAVKPRLSAVQLSPRWMF